MSRLSPFGFLFGNSLTDLIRGMRRAPDAEQRAEYLRGVVTSLRDEARSQRLDTKATAVLKLAYLEMLGFDMSWAGFHVVEVMASPHFQQKRIGYIAAMQSFRGDSELLMLVTNLLKMDLVSQNLATVGIALSGLATIVTPLLAADVADDIMRMLTHSRPYIRQKAILAMYKVVLQYPEALGTALSRLAELLDSAQQEDSDMDASVLCAAVSVIGELAVRSDSVKDFLELTPKLYGVFLATKHNWTLIKLLKIFKLFTQCEPRLRTRLLPAIRNLLTTSEATSLVYECVNAVLEGNMLTDDDFTLADEIVSHTLQLLNERDGNLRYVSLGALGKIAQINASFIPAKPITSLLQQTESDPETRRRILSLAQFIVNDDNLYDIVAELMAQFKAADNAEHKADLARCVCDVGPIDNYAYIPDFLWYISVLAEISRDAASAVVSSRLLDIVIRVKDEDVREAVAALCFDWLEANSDITNTPFPQMCWWILGEFPSASMRRDPEAFFSMLRQHRPSPALATAVAKLLTKLESLSEAVIDTAVAVMEPWSLSLNFELQERACQFLELFKLARDSPSQLEALIQNGLAALFSDYELSPIAPGSQLKIAAPADLDLDTPVDCPPVVSDSDMDSELEDESFFFSDERSVTPATDTPDESELYAAEKELFNLSRPQDSGRNGNLVESESVRPAKAPKPTKKKVLIASDETVDGEGPSSATASKKSDNSVFRVGFRGSGSGAHGNSGRGNARALTEPSLETSKDIASLEPVKVKHKKKSRKSKSGA